MIQQSFAHVALQPARVIAVDGASLVVEAGFGRRRAMLSGRLQHAGGAPERSASDPPSTLAVGDWIAVQAVDDELCIAHQILPRHSLFVRKSAGRSSAPQPIAANIDLVLLVQGLDGDYNPRRLERYLVQTRSAGAEALIVLNKMDLLDQREREARIAEVAALSPEKEPLLISALHGLAMESLWERLKPGLTATLVGSSGAGKSTILNYLLGDERQRTGAVREDDSRGRHTTTRRELFSLHNGACLIDTPGMRELGLFADDSALQETFPEIAALAARCRFADCSHRSEPGCAVLAAAKSGELSGERLQSYFKLLAEERFHQIRADEGLRAEEKRKWRSIHKEIRQVSRRKRGEI